MQSPSLLALPLWVSISDEPLLFPLNCKPLLSPMDETCFTRLLASEGNLR